MMKVKIEINEEPILQANIQRYRGNEDEVCAYTVEGALIRRDGKLRAFAFGQLHLYTDGAEVLAIKALQRIIEHTK